MATRKHWLQEIGEEVRGRAMELVEEVGESLRDSVPFGNPPPEPPKLDLETYLQAPPDMRQAFLQGLPPEEFASTMSDLRNEAVSRFGAAATQIMPMLSLEESAMDLQQMNKMTQAPELGVASAHAELIELLGGMDPFAR